MERKIASGIILTMLLVSMLTLTLNIQLVSTSIQSSLPVHNIDTDEYFPTIQTAINDPDTLNGHTILVDAGTHYEHVTINKPISLIGNNPANTVIDGSRTGIVVKIEASNVTVRGFTIQNGGKTTIIDCGIYAKNHTETISNNVIRNNFNGIWLQGSNGSNIIGNTIRNNTWAVHISESNESIIRGNTIANNSIGAWITSPSAALNTFYHNNFINNENQARDFSFDTVWNNGYPSGGNFWSDYTGADLYSGLYQNETGSDGIGDTPHIPPGDKYPLMSPWGMIPIPGDVNFDEMVDIFDVVLAALAFGSAAKDDPNTPWNETKNWNPYVDLKQDGIIDIFDLVAIGVNFGKTS